MRSSQIRQSDEYDIEFSANPVRDINNGERATKVKFCPHEKGGGERVEKVLAMLKGGTKGFEVVLVQEA